MEYTEVDIRLHEVNPFSDILVAKLNEVEFESYIEDANGVKAYVQTSLFNEDIVKEIITEVEELTQLSYSITKIKQENWNQKWENNSQPIHINNQCVIRADFHGSFPSKKYDLIITPKMSFGTGHHETTKLMIDEMFRIDFKNKSVLDMGSGTGVLSILASKLGAKTLFAIDIDKWAFQNAIENAKLNNISNIEFIHGPGNKIENKYFDIILVNINRNIILNDIDNYVNSMKKNAKLLLSGFLEEDISLILDKSEPLGLRLVCSKNKNKWQMLHFKRS